MGWALISSAICFYEELVFISPDIVYTGISLKNRLFAQIIAAVLAGFTGGSMVVIYFQKWLRTLPYGKALILILFVYSVICIIISYIVGHLTLFREHNLTIFTYQLHLKVIDFLKSADFLRIYFSWFLIMLGTLITLLIQDKYGPGALKDFLLGKYFHPRKEERIFMFLDLRSSTAIAEKLGDEKYFSFIKEVFSDATDPIIYAKGEIYQYVGDEIIISWKMKNGLQNAHCIKCFFDVQAVFSTKQDHYLKTYGISPEFKAGLHYGYVIAGEVGVVKRDIAFSGDVLNTAARIQALCNELNRDLLFSKHLYDRIKEMNPAFIGREIKAVTLRGKEEKITLYTAD